MQIELTEYTTTIPNNHPACSHTSVIIKTLQFGRFKYLIEYEHIVDLIIYLGKNGIPK